MKNLPYFNTHIDPSAFSLVKKTLKSTFLSEGELTAEFEAKLSSIGILNPVCVNSGTSALHLALILADVKDGDEVIIPAQTFIATGLAVLYQRAKPVFADIEYETGNIDVRSIEKKITKKTKAIIPVHWAGYPVDLRALNKLAREHNLTVIEDAAHALGASFEGKSIGSISPFTCFSLQAIKHVTTADGGIVGCKKHTTAQRAKKLRWFGIDRVKAKPSLLGERQYDLDEIGYKYHLNDYSSALGIANLKNLDKRLKRRRLIAAKYQKAFTNISGIQLFSYETNRESSWWVFGMHVEKRNAFIRALTSRGIPSSVVHQRIDKYKVFGGVRSNLINQTKFDSTQIHLPIYDALSDTEVNQIIEGVRKGW